MSIRIHKFEIPVDDKVHEIRCLNAPHLVKSFTDEVVTVWATVSDDDDDNWTFYFTVIGTGHELPDPEVWPFVRGAAVSPSGFVWHLVEVEESTA